MRCLLLGLVLLAGCTVDTEPSLVQVDLELPAHFPSPSAPQDNPLTAEAIELGRHLFYDTRLSVNETISCSSCHKQEFAFADDRSTSPGATGDEGLLNAPSLANVIYASPLTWAHGRITTIEEQLIGPMFGGAPLEMGMSGVEQEIVQRLQDDPRYVELFAAAYPEQPIDLDTARYALASFVRSLVSSRAPFDRFLDGDAAAISSQARRGSELFYGTRLGCSGCHAGFNFTSAVDASGQQQMPFHNIGLYNVDGEGGYPASSQGLIGESGLAKDMGRFRVPSLRNVALTGPYGHDGSVASL